ncbi:hypothetical protein BCR44DRAFT_1101416 [Catenaria anguillulae PL171]|uniref:G-protein coupled receptors family 3 profile domain-containing protein n=1 Tax=Catenaria anguillulae PL171 TaxID=765915 RepID=A0A1Y2I1Y3_9FUNG|nr:hypothetical protein BCR44DRAFT_1101416 [Catenaria anguillulae PL171]
MFKYYLATLGAFATQMLVSGLWFLFDEMPLVSVPVGGAVWVVRIKDHNWLVLVSVPVVLLTLLGLFLAYRTRNVASRFNEGQYVGVATYTIAMTLFVSAQSRCCSTHPWCNM